jgi:hypothetical protein
MTDESYAGASSPDLHAVRQEITELIARNAVSMVQHAIDSVREDGQYQAMKYLFEMIGLYPASSNDAEEKETSLAAVLLSQLGIQDVASAEAKLQQES